MKNVFINETKFFVGSLDILVLKGRESRYCGNQAAALDLVGPQSNWSTVVLHGAVKEHCLVLTTRLTCGLEVNKKRDGARFRIFG